jgi:hypothetical protein
MVTMAQRPPQTNTQHGRHTPTCPPRRIYCRTPETLHVVRKNKSPITHPRNKRTSPPTHQKIPHHNSLSASHEFFPSGQAYTTEWKHEHHSTLLADVSRRKGSGVIILHKTMAQYKPQPITHFISRQHPSSKHVSPHRLHSDQNFPTTQNSQQPQGTSMPERLDHQPRDNIPSKSVG